VDPREADGCFFTLMLTIVIYKRTTRAKFDQLAYPGLKTRTDVIMLPAIAWLEDDTRLSLAISGSAQTFGNAMQLSTFPLPTNDVQTSSAHLHDKQSLFHRSNPYNARLLGLQAAETVR
jgi:hypothetical protein